METVTRSTESNQSYEISPEVYNILSLTEETNYEYMMSWKTN